MKSRIAAGVLALFGFCAVVAIVQDAATDLEWVVLFGSDLVLVAAFLVIGALVVKALDGEWPWDASPR